MEKRIIQGEALKTLKTLPDNFIDCVVTSPPYWALRDYGQKGQLGLEPTFEKYIERLCDIFDEIKRVLKDEGTCWINIGDTYSAQRWSNNKGTSFMAKGKNSMKCEPIEKKSGLPDKNLCQIPARFAIEMQNRGWILRNEIIWWKPNCMPQSVTDRFTVDYEKIFFFSKSQKYYFEQQKEPAVSANDPRAGKGRIHYEGKRDGKKGNGQENFSSVVNDRNKRCVWRISPRPFKEAHFAVYPEELCITPIKAGCPEGGIVLDPFFGSGTTGVVAKKLGRQYLGIELNPKYIQIAEKRLKTINILI